MPRHAVSLASKRPGRHDDRISRPLATTYRVRAPPTFIKQSARLLTLRVICSVKRKQRYGRGRRCLVGRPRKRLRPDGRDERAECAGVPQGDHAARCLRFACISGTAPGGFGGPRNTSSSWGQSSGSSSGALAGTGQMTPLPLPPDLNS